MRRKFLVLAIAALCSIGMQAQWRLGASGGGAINWHMTDYGPFTIENYSRWGGTMDISAQYNFRDWVGIRFGLAMAQRGYSQLYPSTRTLRLYYYDRLYHMLPATVDFSYGNEVVRGYVDLGIYFGHWTDAATSMYETYTGKPEDYQYNYRNEPYQFDSRRDCRFDFGGVARVGIVVYMPKNVFMNLETVYYQSFISSHQETSTRFAQMSYDGTLGIQLGIGYRFIKD